MDLATGSFKDSHAAVDTVNALHEAGFDHVTVYTHDSQKGHLLARTMGREFRPGDTPGRGEIFGPDIYGRLPDDYEETIRASNLPDEAVDWYHHQLDSGHVLVVVEASDRLGDAERILSEHHGMLYGRHEGAETRGMRETRGRAPHEGEMRLPVTEEEVIVEKERREVGEVRVHQEVTSRKVDVPTTVTHDEIRVERRKLDRPVSPDDYQGSREGDREIRLPIIEEEVHVTKRPIIREEMVITRIPVEERETLHEEVRRTEPRLETTGEVEVERMTEEERRRKRPAA